MTLPATERQPYAQKMFFWFFEARNSPEDAPLSVWLQGGPGAPSIDQALDVNGPCIVQEDSNSTVLNPWSWNNHVNMLYVDQPVQAGFSYGEATPSLYDMITGDITAGELSGSQLYCAGRSVFNPRCIESSCDHSCRNGGGMGVYPSLDAGVCSSVSAIH